MVNERRRRRRVPLDIFLNKIAMGVRHMVRAHDISEQGIFVRRLIEPEQLGQVCDLEFQLPGQEDTIWARARTIRDVEDGAYALRFIAMSDQHRELIRSFVAMGQSWVTELDHETATAALR